MAYSIVCNQMVLTEIFFFRYSLPAFVHGKLTPWMEPAARRLPHAAQYGRMEQKSVHRT